MTKKTEAPPIPALPRDRKGRVLWPRVIGFAEWFKENAPALANPELRAAILSKYGIVATRVQIERLRENYEGRMTEAARPQIAAPAQSSSEEAPESLKDRLLRLLVKEKQSLSVSALADLLNVAPKVIREAIASLQADGHSIDTAEDGLRLKREPPGLTERHVHTFSGSQYLFGLVSDTHLGSRCSDEAGLAQAYEVFKHEGVAKVYHSGNLAEGTGSYKGQENILMVWGANAQARYVAERYPKVPGITTYFIGSSTCHEGAYFKQNGLEFGRMPELSERGDLNYLGMDEAEVVLEGARGRATMRLFHPGGGTAYALSYRPQKIVESFGGGDKPNLLVVGHYHKMEYIPALRNVHTIQAGCLEYQSPFMRKLSIEAHRGFWVVLATIEEDGSVTRLRAEAFRFYDPARK